MEERLGLGRVMKLLLVGAALLLAPGFSILLAQRTREALVVDVHAAPYRPSINVTFNIGRQRFDIRNATIVNLIDFAHGWDDDDGREDVRIVGGPAWLDLDRFDVAILIPSGEVASSGIGVTSQSGTFARMRPVVERVLEERFQLKTHTEDRPLPGFVMTLAKDGPKLAEAKDPTAPNGCETSQDKATPGQMLVTCTSETMAEAPELFAGAFRHPLVDRTGLRKSYDFTLRLPQAEMRTREDSIQAYKDAFGKQLGIVIAPGMVAQPAVVVDTVERPGANPPESARLGGAFGGVEFEVASIRPAAGDEAMTQVRPAGSQISFTNFAMLELIVKAWQLPTGAMIADAPAWLGRERFTILAKLPAGTDARAVAGDQDQLAEMLRNLLMDRFQIRYHWGQQMMEGHVLLAGTPKMKRADPESRSFCKYGPAEGERDMRRLDSAFNGMFHCQNVTMAQFGDLLQGVARSEIKNRVPDKTGLTGSYDFSVYFTGRSKLA